MIIVIILTGVFVVICIGVLIYYFNIQNQLKIFQQISDLSTRVTENINSLVLEKMSFLQNQINNTINQISASDNNIKIHMDTLRETINRQFTETTKNLNLQIKNVSDISNDSVRILSTQINERLKDTTQIFSEIKQTLGKLEFSTEQLRQQSDEIRKTLSSVKVRGNFGELMLEKLLLDVLPEKIVKFQYRINPHQDEKVDAAILFFDKVVPIDSKFPLEKFSEIDKIQDEEEKIKFLKTFATKVILPQIDSISQKYVKPEYGAEFAFMYIPSETIFLQIINLVVKNQESILMYALKQKIIITSPQTLYPYLQLVFAGLQTQQVSKNIIQLRQHISGLVVLVDKFRKIFNILGSHIKDAYNKFVDTEKELNNLEVQIKSISVVETKLESKEFLEDKKLTG